MLWLILALIASEVAMLLIGPRVLPVLRKLKFGQTIYELGPKSHRTKQGTPTMGGADVRGGHVRGHVAHHVL